MRSRLAGALAIVAMMAAAAPVRAADEPPVFRLTLKDHIFDPPRLTVPADKRFVLIVKNADPTPAEFESTGMGVEKIISPGREATIRVGPLKAGEYPFVDEFNQDKAHGVLVAAGE